jgi:hypothetical protein
MADRSSQPAERPSSIPGLQLEEKIGEGGMGVVYRAVHLNLQRVVAVKVLPTPADEGAAVPAWLRESRLMASLAHPHVVAIHDAGQVEGHNYLVLEYMAGGSLRSRMEPGRPWPLAEVGPVLDRIAQALGHLHERGVLHLDLKPENILYTADGQLKISDFGLSAPHADGGALLAGRPGLGTPDYCAPEQRAGLALDGRCDVFALATLAYELLTGRLPGRVYVPASRRNPRLPAALDGVLRRGLARDPAERHASIAEFRQALAGACRATRPRARLWVLGSALGLAALAASLPAVTRWKPPPQSLSGPPPQLWVLYDEPEDLAMFQREEGREWPGGPGVVAERVPVGNPPGEVPPELPLPVWPTPRPVLVLHTPGAWGFVHPLLDRTMGQRVVGDWPALLRAAVPPEKNFVRAGGFDRRRCLPADGSGGLWRIDNVADRKPDRHVTLDRPRDQPDNLALLLTSLDPARGNDLLGCYQPMHRAPPPGAAVVLLYRARAESGRPHLQVYLQLPVVIPSEDTGAAATRVRSLAQPLPAEPGYPLANRWRYLAPVWVTPTGEWQTYLVVLESPPFPTRPLHRNLSITLRGAGQVWVDDVELFVWQPGGQP